MLHESDVNLFEISESNLTFEEIYKKPFFPNQYEQELKKANVLLIPFENARIGSGIAFPETTTEFSQFLKEQNDKELISDIVIDDEHYQKLELHSAVITMATCIVKAAVWPIFTSIIAAYIYDEVKKYHRTPNEMTAKLDVYVEKDGKTKRISYEGPASKVEDVLKTPVFEEDKNDNYRN